jgi:hypothetical protein
MAVVMVLTLYTSQVAAQHELHRGPPVIDPNGYDPDLTQPFIEPMTFDSDFQFFAPAPVDRLGGEIDPSIGWFATYDRTYTYVTRPQDQADYVEGDFTWGSRYTFGYMSAEDHGWNVGFMHIDGPNEFRVLEQERINVFNPDDEINGNPDAVDLRAGGGGGGGGQQPGTTPLAGFPVRDRNDPVTGARDYRVHDSINTAKVSGFELNKTFRIDPLHYGSIVEPFFGFRFSNVDDFFRHDVYERFETATGALVFSTDNPAIFPPPPSTIAGISTEQFTTVRTHFDNNMFGGQLGMRWFKQKSRWNLSGEVRVFGLQNFQEFNRVTVIERTQYTNGTGDVTAVFGNKSAVSGHASEFVIGTELRAEAAYNLTKYIRLRGGIQFFDFGRGIGRGNDLTRNDQDLLLVGTNLGFEVNR